MNVDLVAKRLLDVSAAGIGIIILSPVLLLCALAIRATSRGPAIYPARRIGRGGQPFVMYKFRTMVDGADRRGGTSTSAQDPRITRVGRSLRKYKLDEIPQLFNVLNGTMSLVGPRPEVEEYTRLYSAEERHILDVLPGMTDYSSIHYMGLNSILAAAPDPDAYYRDVIRPKKNALRLEYALHRTFFGDIRILARTLYVLLFRRHGDPDGI